MHAAFGSRGAGAAWAQGGRILSVGFSTGHVANYRIDIAQLEQSVSAVDDAALATSIGEVMGTPVTVVSQPPQRGTVSIEVPFLCPKVTPRAKREVSACSYVTCAILS